ncbi:MAG: hypothetical protein IMX01_06380 [Limnochordaceae bacterium]|nr:hypothetical protein [Limnochordaceae bacterium]
MSNSLLIVLALLLSLGLPTSGPSATSPGSGGAAFPGSGPSARLERPPLPLPEGINIATYSVWDPSRRSLPALPPAVTALSRQAARLTFVPWSFRLTAQGQLSPSLPASVLGSLLREVGLDGYGTWALVHNFNGTRFDPVSVSAFLDSPAAQRRAIQELRQTVEQWGLDGVQLDFENVPPAQRSALTHFVADLATALHGAGKQLTLALPAKERDLPDNAWAGAFDYRALGEVADQVTLMTYDQHYPGGEPGPIAAYPWVESVVQYVTSQIPPSRILLGIAGYGYDWPEAGGIGRTVTYSQVQALQAQYGVTPQWDSRSLSSFLRYMGPQGARIVWYQDRRSVAQLLNLIPQYRLAGFALWRLGQEDPGIWAEVSRRLP